MDKGKEKEKEKTEMRDKGSLERKLDRRVSRVGSGHRACTARAHSGIYHVDPQSKTVLAALERCLVSLRLDVPLILLNTKEGQSRFRIRRGSSATYR